MRSPLGAPTKQQDFGSNKGTSRKRLTNVGNDIDYLARTRIDQDDIGGGDHDIPWQRNQYNLGRNADAERSGRSGCTLRATVCSLG